MKVNKKRVYKIKGLERSIVHEMYKTFIGKIDLDKYQICLEGEEVRLDKIYIYDKSCLKRKRLERVYSTMKSRCKNPNNKDYYRYGGRGIIIEESFNTFQKFYLWALEQGYEVDKGLEVDRRDNKGNYSIENCRIVTKSENILNMSTINLTTEDVRFIRSENFDICNPPEKYNCSRKTLEKIKYYKMVKDILSL